MRDGLGGIQSVAVIGGTSEIGLAIARELVALRAQRFVLAGRDPARVEEAARGLPSTQFVDLDLTRPGELARSVDALFEGGDLDVVVVAAGVLHADPTPTEIAEMVTVNGSGSIAVLGLVAERLRAQGHGHLVVLSSIATVRPRPSNYWYGASKVGLDFAARGLADSLVGSGVNVTIVRPGFVHTKMTEGMPSAPFSSKPEAVGEAVVAAIASGQGGVLWIPGILRWVAAVMTRLPRSVLERLDR